MKPLTISFTATFNAFAHGKITAEELRGSFLAFGCMREHLFTKDKLPCEVTWVSDRVIHCYSGEITADDIWEITDKPRTGLLPGEIIEKWVEFFLIVKSKDTLGEIYWECGNYPGLVREALHCGVPVFYEQHHDPSEHDPAEYERDLQFEPNYVRTNARKVLSKLYPELKIEVEE